MKKILLLIFFCCFSNHVFSKVVYLKNKKIISVRKTKDLSIAQTFGTLVQFYSNFPDLKIIRKMKIKFPLMSFRENGYMFVAIEFLGKVDMKTKPENIQVKILPKGKFYQISYKGPYQRLEQIIDDSFKKVIKKGYNVNQKLSLRLLYLNSPDDNHVDDLETLILIPIQ